MKENYTLTRRESDILFSNVIISERGKKWRDLSREVFEDTVETYMCNIKNDQTIVGATLNSLCTIIEDLGYMIFVKTYNSIQNRRNKRKNVLTDFTDYNNN